MNFAEEVKTYKGTANKEALAATTTVPAEESPAEVTSEASKAPEETFSFEQGLPVGADPVVKVEAKAGDTRVEPKIEVKAEGKPAAKIKIGKQEFETIEDAVEYAKELERAAAEDKAYIEGLKDAQVKAEAKTEEKEPEKTAYDIFSEKVFEDPKVAAQEFAERIKQEIRDEYNRSLTEAQKAREAAELKQKAWDTFYQTYTDLSSPETRDLLENYLLPKLAREKQLEPTDGFDKFADLARKHLKIVKEATQPTKELPSGPVAMPGTTASDTSQAVTPKTEENLDFITALKRLRAGSKK